MERVNGSPIVKPRLADVRCQCIVDLIRRGLFRVTVTGQPPHAVTKVYDIRAKTDDSAASKAMALFTREMLSPNYPTLTLLQ